MEDIYEVNYEINGDINSQLIKDVLTVDKEINKELNKIIECDSNSLKIIIKGKDLKKIRSSIQNIINNMHLIIQTENRFPQKE